MIKKIQMNETQSVEINSSAGWLFVYRETFGHDILPDVMPVLEAMLMAVPELVTESDGVPEVTLSSVLDGINNGALINSMAMLGSLEITSVIQIFWAMAKNADKSIPSVDEWVNGFDTFPVDEIAPALFMAITESMVSSKNLQRLIGKTKEAFKGVRKTESLLTESSLEQSAEDLT